MFSRVSYQSPRRGRPPARLGGGFVRATKPILSSRMINTQEGLDIRPLTEIAGDCVYKIGFLCESDTSSLSINVIAII